jgi:hypothetical protein
MDLHAVSVELDLMNPAGAGWHLRIEDAKAGSMKPGNGALTPRTSVFLR